MLMYKRKTIHAMSESATKRKKEKSSNALFKGATTHRRTAANKELGDDSNPKMTNDSNIVNENTSYDKKQRLRFASSPNTGLGRDNKFKIVCIACVAQLAEVCTN